MVWVVIYLLLHTSENLYSGTRSFSEFTVTVRKDSISKVAKHFCSCRRSEIFWIRNWLVSVTIVPVTALWWRSTEPRDGTHVCKLSKWDRFCAYECLPKYLCARGHIMKWKPKVQGDNIILTLDVISVGTLCWIFGSQFWSLHHFHNSYNWDAKIPFPRLTDLNILVADAYFLVQLKLRYQAPSGQKGCLTSSFSGYYNVVPDT